MTELLIIFVLFIGYHWLNNWILTKPRGFLKQGNKIKTKSKQQTKLYIPIVISKTEKQNYLSSPIWQTKRKQRLVIDNYTCQMCGSQEPLEVHHIHYRTFKQESMDDLVSLCRKCHAYIHQTYGYNHNDIFPIIKS